MIVIVDMDEVLYQFVAKVLRRWNSRNGTHFTRDDVDCWRMEQVLGKDALGRSAEGLIDQWLGEPGFFDNLKPMPGAIEGFNALRAQGHDVLVATSLPEVARHAFDGKRRCMRRDFPDWSMKNFVACSRKGLLEGDVLLDDGAHNIRDWVQSGRAGALLFDAPWNRDEDFGGRPVRRVRGWGEALEAIGKMQRDREDAARTRKAAVDENVRITERLLEDSQKMLDEIAKRSGVVIGPGGTILGDPDRA